MPARESAMTGRVIDDSQPVGESANWVYPVGLNHPRLIANTSTSPMAIRKPGTAKPSTDTNCTTRSTQPPRRAARTPSSTETTATTNVAPMTRDSVTASRLVMASATGWLVNQEAPRSPCSAEDSQWPNWVSTG